MNQDVHKEDQVHKYVHGGLLQGNAPEDTNMDERQRSDGNYIQQNVPEEVQDEQSAIETQEYGQYTGDCHEDQSQAEEPKENKWNSPRMGDKNRRSLKHNIT
eukprot:15543751-Heterocapsa_arctica.AAC.1